LLAFRGLFSFSFMPIRLLFTLGVAILALVIPLIIGYAVWRIVEPSAWPPGIATLVILLFTQIGLTMLGIGLIGEYLSIIFIEVKNRPTYVVRSLINLEEQEVEGRDDERRPRP
jgi:polyisoprenyl-phosphate glycosyltransferase